VTAPSSDRTAAVPVAGTRAAPPEVYLRIAGITDLGLVRSNNEDAFAVASLEPGAAADGDLGPERHVVGRKGILLVVSDGMGGHSAGEVASRIAVETTRHWLREEWGARPERDAVEELRNDLRAAVASANREVLEEGERNPDRRGLGSTLTAAVVLGTRLLVAHVGDSRCYLLRRGVLKPLTVDQSLAEELVRRGMVERGSEEYAARRSVLTRVVGQPGKLEPEGETADLCRGDRLLLCSDGLHGPVGDETLTDILSTAAGPAEAVRELVAEAHRGGAPDNCTCVVAFAEGPGLPDPDAAEGGGATSSLSLDPALAEGGGDATLAIEVARRDATAEFAVESLAARIPGDGIHREEGPMAGDESHAPRAASHDGPHSAAEDAERFQGSPPGAPDPRGRSDPGHGHSPDSHGHAGAAGGHAAAAHGGHHAPAVPPSPPSALGACLAWLAGLAAAWIFVEALRR
jgi:serine/threonine protein phosphatase PrpC